MGIFKTKEEKEQDMMLLIKRTVTVMQKQIKLLQAQKKVFFDRAAKAREEGMEDLMCASLAAYKQADAQLSHAKEAMMAFEAAAEIKECADATAAFAGAMAVISREMVSLTDEKTYGEIEQGFKKSMAGAKVASEHLQTILAMEKRLFSAPLAEEKKEDAPPETPEASEDADTAEATTEGGDENN